MKRIAGLAAAVVALFGCAPSPPQPAADNPRASVEGPPGVRDYIDNIGWAESPGAPLMPWPKFQAGLANGAELAIILRGHELRERHPGATPSELAEMLARDDVWNQNARFVQSERRTLVTREALMPW
jgi:hypothetical protein